MDLGKILFGLAEIMAIPTIGYMLYFVSKNGKEAKWPINLKVMMGILAIIIASSIIVPNLK